MKRSIVMFVLCFAIIGMLFNPANVAGGAKQEEGAKASGPKRYIFTTTNPGGTNYVMLNAMVELFNKAYGDRYLMDMIGSGGSVENTRRMVNKEAEFGLNYGYHLMEGKNGIGILQGHQPVDNLRVMFMIYDSTVYFVTLANKNIKTTDDIRGKRVVLGATGSGMSDNSRRIMSALDIQAQTSEMGFADGARALQEGRIDVLGISGHPADGVTELANTREIFIIPFSDADMATIMSKTPYYAKGILPANVYKGQPNSIQCPVFAVYIACDVSVEDDAVYLALKEWFSEKGRAYLESAHPLFLQMGQNPEDMKNIGMVYHPGAQKFWDEFNKK